MKRIYFIGIGGVGMSAVAGFAAGRGWQVKGSDVGDAYDPARSVLERYSIQWAKGFAAENIAGCFDGEDPELVIVGASWPQDNPELIYAHSKNIQVISFPEALNLIASGLRQIVISGTHGKSTTSGLVGHALKALQDSSFMVGAVLVDYNANFYAGSGPDIVIEGDEYFASDTDHRPKFMLYHPHILLINNIEFDHPDAFASFEEVLAAFIARIQSMPENGIIVYNADEEQIRNAVAQAKVKTIGFGFTQGNIRFSFPHLLESGMFEISITMNGKTFSIQSRFPGLHYAYDFSAALSVVLTAYPNVNLDELQEIFANYHGVKRRFEIILDGKDGGPIVIDDYAHHPTAVRQTIEATRMKYPNRRIVCFFEPHTYSRTKETLKELTQAFGQSDVTYIAEVYPAREQRLASSITGKEVVAAVQADSAPSAIYVETKEQALEEYLKIAQPNDVVLVMAVGAFNQLAYEIKESFIRKVNR